MDVTPPRIEVGGVRLHVLGVGQAMRVEDEFVGRKEQVAQKTFDALGPRRVVARRKERATTSPRALMAHVECEVFRKLRRTLITCQKNDQHVVDTQVTR